MREKFTDEEWRLLKLLPLHLFVMVAGADKKIDEKEAAQLQKDLQGAALYKDPLHRELFVDLVSSDMGSLIQDSMDLSKLAERAGKIKKFLKEKLTTDEYQRFVGSLFINGIKIARASGGGLLGRGSKVSDEEGMALAAFGAMFDLDVKRIKEFFG